MVIARSIFVVRTKQISCDIRGFVSRRKIVVIPLCIAINVLHNKTIILLNLAEYRLILANSAYGLVG